MKRTLALIFAAMLSLAALTGCADTGLYGPAGNISTTDNGRVNGGGYATPPANGARRTDPRRTGRTNTARTNAGRTGRTNTARTNAGRTGAAQSGTAGSR